MSRCSLLEAAEIDANDDEADGDGAADHGPPGKIGINDRVEEMREEGSGLWLKSCSHFEPILRDGKRAGRPRRQLDEDGIDERADVKPREQAAAASERPAKDDPGAPQQMDKQHRVRKRSVELHG